MGSLTEQQRLYAEARFKGLSKKDAAIAAGCPEKTAAQAGSRLEKHPHVLEHLARLKAIESKQNPSAGADPLPPGADEQFFDDPKEMLRHAMNDRRLDYKTRLEAAKSLLPYEHQKMGETGKKEEKAQAAGKVVQGRFKQAPPPQMRLV